MVGRQPDATPQSSFLQIGILLNDKHWSNESTMIHYIENVIVPFVTRVRNDLGVGQEQAALAIFDSFRGQITEKVFILLNKYNIQSVVVPPNCTDKLQPLDLTVNKVAKSFLQKQFIDRNIQAA